MLKITKRLARNQSVFSRILAGQSNKEKDLEVSNERSVISEGRLSSPATQITSRHPEGIKSSMFLIFHKFMINFFFNF